MDEVLAQLLEYLDDHDSHWVISLDGMAGLGKTALAREAAGTQVPDSDYARDILALDDAPAPEGGEGGGR